MNVELNSLMLVLYLLYSIFFVVFISMSAKALFYIDDMHIDEKSSKGDAFAALFMVLVFIYIIVIFTISDNILYPISSSGNLTILQVVMILIFGTSILAFNTFIAYIYMMKQPDFNIKTTVFIILLIFIIPFFMGSVADYDNSTVISLNSSNDIVNNINHNSEKAYINASGFDIVKVYNNGNKVSEVLIVKNYNDQRNIKVNAPIGYTKLELIDYNNTNYINYSNNNVSDISFSELDNKEYVNISYNEKYNRNLFYYIFNYVVR